MPTLESLIRIRSQLAEDLLVCLTTLLKRVKEQGPPDAARTAEIRKSIGQALEHLRNRTLPIEAIDFHFYLHWNEVQEQLWAADLEGFLDENRSEHQDDVAKMAAAVVLAMSNRYRLTSRVEKWLWRRLAAPKVNAASGRVRMYLDVGVAQHDDRIDEFKNRYNVILDIGRDKRSIDDAAPGLSPGENTGVIQTATLREVSAYDPKFQKIHRAVADRYSRASMASIALLLGLLLLGGLLLRREPSRTLLTGAVEGFGTFRKSCLLPGGVSQAGLVMRIEERVGDYAMCCAAPSPQVEAFPGDVLSAAIALQSDEPVVHVKVESSGRPDLQVFLHDQALSAGTSRLTRTLEPNHLRGEQSLKIGRVCIAVPGEGRLQTITLESATVIQTASLFEAVWQVIRRLRRQLT